MDASPPTYIEAAAPFLKWAGGKRRLLKHYKDHFPALEQIGRYYEPFVGSAAVYFHLQPPRATLADINGQLVEIYRVVQQQVEALIQALQGHENDEGYYYEIRGLNPADLSPVQRAARLIYLNRTCYNGLYRENQQGQFNVPFGRYKNPRICQEKRLLRAHQALQGVHLQAADFDEVVEPAMAGDFVYFDPPYVPLSATSSFTSYNRHGFDAADQHRLAETFGRLADRGCVVMLSNSSAPLVYELYDGRGYEMVEVPARRSINSKANGRGPVTELLIISRP